MLRSTPCQARTYRAVALLRHAPCLGLSRRSASPGPACWQDHPHPIPHPPNMCAHSALVRSPAQGSGEPTKLHGSVLEAETSSANAADGGLKCVLRTPHPPASGALLTCVGTKAYPARLKQRRQRLGGIRRNDGFLGRLHGWGNTCGGCAWSCWPKGHHIPRPPGHVAWSGPCPLRGHEAPPCAPWPPHEGMEKPCSQTRLVLNSKSRRISFCP